MLCFRPWALMGLYLMLNWLKIRGTLSAMVIMEYGAALLTVNLFKVA